MAVRGRRPVVGGGGELVVAPPRGEIVAGADALVVIEAVPGQLGVRAAARAAATQAVAVGVLDRRAVIGLVALPRAVPEVGAVAARPGRVEADVRVVERGAVDPPVASVAVVARALVAVLGPADRRVVA